MKVILSFEINEQGEVNRLRNPTPDPEMTRDQRDTWETIYQHYHAVQRAWVHWFSLRERFLTRRGPDKIAEERQAVWEHDAQETDRLLRESEPKLRSITRKVG